MAALARKPAGPSGADDTRARLDLVEWNETAAMAMQRMRLTGVESLVVVAGEQVLGRIRRRDIERCERRGNWLDAVLVRDLLHDPRDTCN